MAKVQLSRNRKLSTFFCTKRSQPILIIVYIADGKPVPNFHRDRKVKNRVKIQVAVLKLMFQIYKESQYP